MVPEIRVSSSNGGSGLSNIAKGLLPPSQNQYLMVKGQPVEVVQKHAVAVTDDGGTTGELLQYGATVAMGDILNVAQSMSRAKNVERFRLRFGEGPYKGISLRNFIFYGWLMDYGLDEALKRLFCELELNKHEVYPASRSTAVLSATIGNGHPQVPDVVRKGETNIANFYQSSEYDPKKHRIKDLAIEPKVAGHEIVLDFLENWADYIPLGPGSYHTSLRASLLPDGISDAIRRSSAKIIFIPNLMEMEWGSKGYRVEEFLMSLEEQIGRPCDVVLLNCRGRSIPQSIWKEYQWQHKDKVNITGDLAHDPRSVFMPLLGISERKAIIHDPELVRAAFLEIFKKFPSKRMQSL